MANFTAEASPEGKNQQQAENDNAPQQASNPELTSKEQESEGGRNAELIRLVKSAAGRELFVSSAAANILDKSSWGSLLGAAPDALGRLAQCFVLVSDPVASSLEIRQGSGIE